MHNDGFGPGVDASTPGPREAPAARRWVVLLLFGACIVAGSCGPPQASLRLAAAPQPLPVNLVRPCAGVFAMFPCSAANYLEAKWTLSVSSTNDVGGRAAIEVQVVDAATGQPLPDPRGSVSGQEEVVLAPSRTVTVPLEWKRLVSDAGPGRIPPLQLAFVVSIQFTDTRGNRVFETVTVLEALPRPWQIF